MLVCDGIAQIRLIVLLYHALIIHQPESELYFMLPLFYVSFISLGLTFFCCNTDVK